MKKYHAHSSFLTLQGEGVYTGRPTVFVRFSGCNVWSGQDQDRLRARSLCGRICDTAFVGSDAGNGGGSYTALELVERVLKLWGSHAPPVPRVTFTGGEPALQVDDGLVQAFQRRGVSMAAETNGTLHLPNGIGWVSVSPKPPLDVVLQSYSEVKLLYPLFSVDPETYRELAPILWLQPVDPGSTGGLLANARACVEYALAHPEWSVSCQVHKLLGIQ